jgi:hypothetical protein
VNKIALLALSLGFLSVPAFAKTVISVQCGCSYYLDYISQNILAGGTRTNPTDEEISNCIIEKGKVLSGCFAAKMNAQFNCQQTAWAYQPNDIRPPQVLIHEDQCYGAISEEAN